MRCCGSRAFNARHGFRPTGENIPEDEWMPLVKMALA